MLPFQSYKLRTVCTDSNFSVFSPQKIIHLGMTLETPFSPLSFGKSFMKICSAVPENSCLIFMHYRVADEKKTKKNKKKQKNICKTYTHSHHLAAWMRKLTRYSITRCKMSITLCLHPRSVVSTICYSTLPWTMTFWTVNVMSLSLFHVYPQCINSVSLVKIHRVFFEILR